MDSMIPIGQKNTLAEYMILSGAENPSTECRTRPVTRINTSGTRRNYSGQQRVVRCFNCQWEGHMARQCPKPKRKRVLHAYQADDLDAYDLTGRVISASLDSRARSRANLSSYGSDFLSEVPHSENTHTDMLNQSVQEMSYFEQTHIVNYPENEITSDSNIIPYSHVISKETNVISIDDSEETLMLEEDSRSKMLLKQKLSDEQAFRLQTLHPNTDQSASSPVKIEAPQELPKTLKDILNVDKQCFEIQKKQFLIENDRLLDQIISQDIVNIVVNSSVDMNTSVNVHSFIAMNDSVYYVEMKRFCHNSIKNDLRKLKGKDIVDNAAQVSNATNIAPGMYKIDPVTLAPKDKNNRETHIYYLKHTMEQAVILREIVEQAKSLNPLDSTSYSTCKYVKLIQELLGYVRDTCPNIHKPSEKLVAVTPINKKNTVSYMFDARHELCFLEFVSDMNASSKSKSVKKAKKKEEWKPTGKVFTKIGYNWRPTGRTFTLVGNACPLTRITATNKVPLREPIPLEVVAQESVVTKVYTRRPKIGNIIISRVYYMEGLGYNLFSVGQFYDSDLEVAFRKHTCFVRNLNGDDLLLGSSRPTLIRCPIGNELASLPVCLLSEASKNKSWLWHQRLSHLNFDAINHLARHGLVRGLPKLKFEKDHLCSTCAMGKCKKQSHKPKSEDTNQEKLYLLHMDLCWPMRVASINGKKYILVIVDDYSRFTWVKFLASKDEALDFIIKTQTSKYDSFNIQFRILNTIPQQPCIPPPRDDWDRLFQPMFDEYFNLPTIVGSPVPVVVAPRAVELADSPVSTSIDQDAPSTSIPSTHDQKHSLIISQGFEESLKTPHFHYDLLHESLHEDSTSLSSNVRPIHTPFESLGRWTKDHPIANVIGDPSRSVSTRKQLQTDAMWCYFDAFLTFVEPKNFKQAMTEPSWIDALQE
ncbi:retrovirus-related pol polyprotein from transposon TNT 1-94 [Tanacetum coccineum]